MAHGTSNLLHETLEYLEICHKTTQEIHWIGSEDGDYTMTWEDFEILADTEYGPEVDAYTVAADLVVVGMDWWLRREPNANGIDCWVYNQKPMCNVPSIQISQIFVPWNIDMYIYDLNNGENGDQTCLDL